MMRILVVEDEKLLCDGIAEDLELEKYTVERCYDGAEAYDLLLSESFDLLILDLNLPGMDGLDLLRSRGRLRRSGSRRSCRWLRRGWSCLSFGSGRSGRSCGC